MNNDEIAIKQQIITEADQLIKKIEREQKIQRVKEKAKKILLWTWKLYNYLRSKHKFILIMLSGVAKNIGVFIIALILLYYAIVWWPYTGVINYIVGLISGKNINHFINNYVIPWGIGIIIIAIIMVVLYYTVWDLFFPRLYLVRRDGEEIEEGRVYFYSPERKIIYANLDRFLNIFTPYKSLRLLHVDNEKILKREGTKFKVHAAGIVHLHDFDYKLADEYIPQQVIHREIIEKQADREQAHIEYRTSRSLRYNPEINKSKYKSTIILLPAAIFKTQYKAPEESIRGIIENLRSRIELFEQINEQALTDEEVQEDLGQKLAPLTKEIYEFSRMLEEYIPELKEKNDAFLEDVKNSNVILGDEYFNDNLNVRQIALDSARKFVAGVRAVLESYENTGGVEGV